MEAFDTSTDKSPDRQSSARRVDHTRALEKFFGYNYEELCNWLYQLEAIADVDRWSARDRLKNARIHLSGRARIEASAFERKLETRGEQLTWKKFVAFLKRKFGPADPHVHYTERLIACQHGPRDDVDAFTTRFRTLVFSSCWRLYPNKCKFNITRMGYVPSSAKNASEVVPKPLTRRKTQPRQARRSGNHDQR